MSYFNINKKLYNLNDNSRILKKHDKKIKISTDIENYNLLVNLRQNLPPRVKIPFFTGEKKLFVKSYPRSDLPV